MATATRKKSSSRKSSLSPRTNQRRNTQSGRQQMSGSQFAIPSERKYRIDDKAHARNALARVEQHGSPGEKRKVRAAVKRKYPSIGQSSSSSSSSSRRKRSS